MTTPTLTPEERAAAQARQQKRYRDQQALKQYEEREHLRGEIESRTILRNLMTIHNMLYVGREEVITPSGELISQELDRTRQSGLAKSAEIGFKMLNKTIPDLKQIELRADVTEEALPQHITYHVIRPEALDDDD